MDEVVNKLAGLGVAGLVLLSFIAMSPYVGAAAITSSLALLGGPLGMIGGAVTLAFITTISSAITKYGVETVAINVVKKIKESGKSEAVIIEEINKFPITAGLRAQLHEQVRKSSN